MYSYLEYPIRTKETHIKIIGVPEGSGLLVSCADNDDILFHERSISKRIYIPVTGYENRKIMIKVRKSGYKPLYIQSTIDDHDKTIQLVMIKDDR